jgi:polyhydroxybutyrate depolymerase
MLFKASKLPIAPVMAILCGAFAACSPSSNLGEGMDLEEFDYSSTNLHIACARGTKAGAAGATDGVKSSQGIRYNVRTPANYDSAFAHPLLLVYAPAGASASKNESLTRLTSAATKEGFIIVYTSHRSMSIETVNQLARLPKEVANTWCIDLGRVYATGHSDGGTVSTAIAVLDETKGTVTGIAPSAAGFSKKDFETLKCPSSPMPVMVMHSKKDALFPGWGADAAAWWAACNGCDLSKPPQTGGEPCVAYQGCATSGQTLYCEGEQSHSEWPGLSEDIIWFLRHCSGEGAPLICGVGGKNHPGG